jgi:FKBP-type peptidyl-prolyl cis-trans isomerase FkpA
MRRLMGIVLAAVLTAACGGGHEDDALSKTTLTRLESTDLKPGTGAEARQGRRVSVHYTGWLYHPTKPDHKGRQFDSSRDRNRPFDLTLGAGEVIPGWEQGLLGMKAGGQRRIVIPPGLAYGSSGQGDIPPDATLVFDLELVTVQ